MDDLKASYTNSISQITEQEKIVQVLKSNELVLRQSLNELQTQLQQAQLASQSSHSSEATETEKLKQSLVTLTSERNASQLSLEGASQECEGLRRALQLSKEGEQKLERELQRLRSHLVQIEESYTMDALESENREKELRNRLALAEEKAASSTTAVQRARYVSYYTYDLIVCFVRRD